MKPHILQVIDDEPDRRSLYEQLFGDHYQLRFTEKPEDFFDSTFDDVYCFIIDVFLPNWQKDTKSNLLFEIIDSIGEFRPIILVSSKWDEVITILNDRKTKKFNILGTIGLKDIFVENKDGRTFNKNAPLASTIFFVKQKLNEFYDLTNDSKGSDENINILHISDLQFGDPNWDSNTFLSEFLIPKYLRRKNFNIDFIVITGDFTYSALPNQFNQCLKWLNVFCQEIFDFTEFHDRILVVPGNHDINLSINSLSSFEYDFSFKDGKYLKKRDSKIDDFANYSFFPFKEFATQLTKSSKWIKNISLSFINDRFSHWGIRFVHLNTVETCNVESPKNFGLRKTSIEHIISERKKTVNSNIFNIYLSHLGPDDLGYKKGEESSESWIVIRNLIETLGGDAFLHGHRHSIIDKYQNPETGEVSSKVKYFMSGTLNLKNVGYEGGRRGFSIISLERKDGEVINLALSKFEIHQDKITEIT